MRVDAHVCVSICLTCVARCAARAQLGAVTAVIAAAVASGGGDFPEDVSGGLQKCTDLSWASRTRIIVHIADAPAHGEEYHDGSFGDNHGGNWQAGARYRRAGMDTRRRRCCGGASWGRYGGG